MLRLRSRHWHFWQTVTEVAAWQSACDTLQMVLGQVMISLQIEEQAAALLSVACKAQGHCDLIQHPQASVVHACSVSAEGDL